MLGSAKQFLLSRLRGEAPLRVVFWRDMIVTGTLINLLAGFCGLLLIAAGLPSSTALFVYFSPLPWNMFLFWSVWRSAEQAQPSQAQNFRAGAMVWFVLAAML